MLREGAQECEARLVLENALADKTLRGKLGDALVKRCDEILKERDTVFRFVSMGGWSRPEGWEWYESSGWEDRALDLFNIAGDVAKAMRN
jgi:hypothetical protein